MNDEEFQKLFRQFEIQSIAKQDQDLQEFRDLFGSLSRSQQAEFREAVAMVVKAQETFSKLSEHLDIHFGLSRLRISEDGDISGAGHPAHLTPVVLGRAIAAWDQGLEFLNDDSEFT